MAEVVAIFLALMVIVLLFVAVALIIAAVTMVALGLGAGYLLWRALPIAHRVRRALRQSPIDHLTDHYVAGHIDIGEFERRLGKVLAHRAP